MNNLEQMIQQNNASELGIKNYKCDKCKDLEVIIFKDEEGRTITRQCECFKINQSQRRLERTALFAKKDEYTFEKYNPENDWQKGILEKAKKYVKDANGWFFIGGQPGAGKTHICTAILRNLSYIHNLSYEYILFNQKMTELKQWKFDDKLKYAEELNRLINTNILFIDDLFKIQPTNADLEILFDIINNRYLNNGICIISSEKYINDICKIDEAIGSRIYEKSKDNLINIKLDKNKDYRLKNSNIL